MKMRKPAGRGAVLLLVVALIVIPINAQQQVGNGPPRPSPATATHAEPSPAKKAETTFDTLLAGDSYAIYGEVRMLGQQGRSGGLFQVLEPLRSIAGAPKELTEFSNFLDTHADILSGARMMFAAEPGRTPLPEGIAAVELSSVEAAQKFEPELRSLLTKLNSSAATTEAPSSGGTKKPARAVTGEAAKTKPGTATPSASFFIKRAGKLIVVSETPFTFESLRPEKSRALSDEPNFLTARNRLSSESLFLYFNVELMERLSKQQREKYEAEAKERELAQQKDAARLKNRTRTIRENNNQTEHTVPADTQVVTSQPNDENGAVSSSSVTVTAAPSDQSSEPPPANADSGAPARTENGPDQLTMLAPLLFRFAFGDFGGEIKMPQAIGAAATLEGDALIVRALLINAPGKQVKPIPFFPLLISDSPLTPEAPAVLPADTEIFIGASLDSSQIYGALLGMMGNSAAGGSPGTKPATSDRIAATLRIAAFERLAGFSIKEDLLPTLGSEVAVSIPGTSFRGSPTNPTTATTPTTQSGVVFLISLKDQDRLQTILRRAFEALGLKNSGQADQAGGHGGVEIDNYGPFSLAFVNNFLVVGQSAADISHVADAYTKQETLAANNDFRAWTGWQPRQSLMQVYASPKFIRSLFADAERTINQGGDDEAKVSLSRLNLDLGAITHAVTIEGSSSILHELHLPKDLLLLLMTEEAFYSRQAPVINGEAMAIYTLKAINEAETKYQSTKGKGNFATLDELTTDDLASGEKLVPKYLLKGDKYKIELTVSGNKFEATATPIEYGKTGRRSFFLDESKIIRGADHGGARATAEDEPVR